MLLPLFHLFSPLLLFLLWKFKLSHWSMQTIISRPSQPSTQSAHSSFIRLPSNPWPAAKVAAIFLLWLRGTAGRTFPLVCSLFSAPLSDDWLGDQRPRGQSARPDRVSPGLAAPAISADSARGWSDLEVAARGHRCHHGGSARDLLFGQLGESGGGGVGRDRWG